MLEAWLAGDVPHEVMADWCEQHGCLFPRAVVQPFRVRVGVRVEFLTFNSWSEHDAWRTSESGSRAGATEGAYSHSRQQAGGVSSSRSGSHFGQSTSGSRTSADE